MSDYKPTEHDGLRQDGKPDGRVNTGAFAHGKVDPTEAGKSGGSVGGEQYKPTENDGTTKDGGNDSRVGTGQFAGGKVDPVEAGKAGGSK